MLQIKEPKEGGVGAAAARACSGFALHADYTHVSNSRILKLDPRDLHMDRNTCNVRTERNLTAKYPIIFQFIFDYICRGSFYRIASNQPLYINQILHKPFGKRSKNVLRYW